MSHYNFRAGFVHEAVMCATLLRLEKAARLKGNEEEALGWATQYGFRHRLGCSTMCQELNINCHGGNKRSCHYCKRIFQIFIRLSEKGKV